MNTHELTEASRIRDHHADLLRTERTCLANLLVSVADFEHRGLHRALGYATIFQYLHRALSMSKGMAHYRMVGARLVRRFPEVEAPIRDGRLCLTTVVEVARVMTEENRAEVLPRFFGLSRQEAKEVAAEIEPARVVPRRTVVSAVVTELVPMKASLAEVGSTVEPTPTHPRRDVEAPVRRDEAERTSVLPLTATESRLHITVSREFLALLKKAKAGESHRNPGATDEQILKLALEALIEKQGKRKAGVPAKVKREVLARDEGKCQWPLADGGICGKTVRLEIDHVHPRGKGGPSTVDNCRVLCRGHNLEAARQSYGDEVMDLFTRRVPAPMAREEAAAHAPGPSWRPPPPGTPPFLRLAREAPEAHASM
ncbi:MAG TPA: HNH endonuclease signature motif containing protein [Anaeromyxobacteraceae bacterium]|nr:HNH endonuclease signature motif containing protein [Anaeromyxobacteraceae bacterium]